jgi:hypothetical protein
MWRTLTRWWRARRARGERVLFEFFDGRSFRRADPWQVYRAITNDPHFDFENHMPFVLEGQEPESTHCLECVCRAFSVARFDGRWGLTDHELLALLDTFLVFCEDLKKKVNTGPISSRPMASTSSTGPADQPVPTS